MTTVAELMSKSLRILDILETHDWEITPEMCSEMQGFLEEADDKLGGMLYALNRFEIEKAAIMQHIAALQRRKNALENSDRFVRELITGLLLSKRDLGEEPKYIGKPFSASLSSREFVSYPQRIENWPAEWTKTQITEDKQAARRAVLDGAEVPGFGKHTADVLTVRGVKTKRND